MAAKLTYIRITKHGATIFDEVLCETHLAELPERERTPHKKDRHGYALEVRPYAGPCSCSSCDVAPEFQGGAR